MDRGRFRSTGGRDDDYESEEQYLEEDDPNTGDDAGDSYPAERPVRKSRSSSRSPIPPRSHNPSTSQDVYYARREQQRKIRSSQTARRIQEGSRRAEQGEMRVRRPQRPREEYYEETPRRVPAQRPPVYRQTTRRTRPDEDEVYARPTRSARPSAQPARRTRRIDYETRPLASERPSRPPRRRRGWPFLMSGCVIGIILTIVVAVAVILSLAHFAQGVSIPGVGGIGATQSFQKSETQTITLSAFSQLQICDTIGNVSVLVDPNAPSTMLTTTKIVHATSQTNANQEFGRIGVAVQQPANLPANQTCTATSSTTPTTSGTPAATTPTVTTGSTSGILTIQTAIPNSTSLIRTSSDAINLQLVIAPSAFTGATSLPQISIQALIGDITVNGLNGVLNVRGNSGNVTVTNAKLINGSKISTGQGNVTFNGTLLSPQDTTTDASFIIQSEKGQIDVTLPNAPTTNVVLSASTNVGTIHSDFPITPTTDGNGASFRGPLNSSAAVQSIAVLTLNVSTGNISIHKT